MQCSSLVTRYIAAPSSICQLVQPVEYIGPKLTKSTMLQVLTQTLQILNSDRQYTTPSTASVPICVSFPKFDSKTFVGVFPSASLFQLIHISITGLIVAFYAALPYWASSWWLLSNFIFYKYLGW